MVPQRIGRYEVLGQLAVGGMAEILLARLSGPHDFARAVVLKRMLPRFKKDPALVTMFFDEARIIAEIRHPNVVAVTELERDGDETVLVLEYVEGENLSLVLSKSTTSDVKLDPMLAAHIVAEACAGLHAAHELVGKDGKKQNLVHRDVSPQNLFVAYDGHVKLLDFGVARVDERESQTDVGVVKGKVEYMSPEQVQNKPLDRRSDIFALGIVLYELTTGRRLFRRINQFKTMQAIAKDVVIPPSRVVADYPAALEPIVMRALMKEPEKRFQTASEMRRALLEITRGLDSPTELLSERMHFWFPDRIAEKTEMLQRVREGAKEISISKQLPREADITANVPGVPLEEPKPLDRIEEHTLPLPPPPAPSVRPAPPSMPSLPPPPVSTPQPEAPSRRLVGTALFCGGLLGVMALFILVGRRDTAKPTNPGISSSSAPTEIQTSPSGHIDDDLDDAGEPVTSPTTSPPKRRPRPKPSAHPAPPPPPPSSSGFRRFD